MASTLSIAFSFIFKKETLTAHVRHTLFGAILALSLTACVHQPATTHIEETKHKFNDPVALTTFNFRGKAGLRQPKKSVSANIVWDQFGEDFDIELFGPFGIGHSRIEKRGQQASLTYKGTLYDTDTIQNVFFHATGMNLPLQHVHWWARGLEAPGVKTYHRQRNEAGYITGFTQAQWQIDFQRFTVEENYKLPEKLTISNGEYRLTLIIKSWTLSKSAH